MRYVLTAEEMKRCDCAAMAAGLGSPVLMERAALGVVKALLESGFDTRRVLIVCGGGNNGGDGIAAARLLRQRDVSADVLFLGDESACTPQTAHQLALAGSFGVPILRQSEMAGYTSVVDALLGIGLSRPVEGKYRDAVYAMNASGADILAVDIPSGIDADTGHVMGCAVLARETVTFATEKRGLLLYPGAEHAGRISVADIGIPQWLMQREKPQAFCYTREDLARLPGRRPYSNKGSYGKVLVIAGSPSMAGAAILSAGAAYRAGAGLVCVCTAQENRVPLQTALPEAVLLACHNDMQALRRALEACDSVVLGPGIGMGENSRQMVREVMTACRKPLVLDADGLNLAAQDISLLRGYRGEAIVTPHLKEMERLSGIPVEELARDVPEYALQFAYNHRVITVLKDARTAVSDGKTVYINTSGNSGMATGGTGDVLTGVIASLLAQGATAFEAATLGVYAHGLAGDRAAQTLSEYGLMAGDVRDALAGIMAGQATPH